MCDARSNRDPLCLGGPPPTPRPSFEFGITGADLTPSPARDVPRIDPATADVERLARFLDRCCELSPHRSHNLVYYRERAREMVRDFDELEEILAEILTKGGRF